MNSGAGRAPDVKIDPELLQQLESGRDRPVEAVVQLRGRPSDDPAETNRLVLALIERAEQHTHQRAVSSRVFAYLGVFGVVALPAIIREILRQPEVQSATVPQHVASKAGRG
jgi:hypothetical protein